MSFKKLLLANLLVTLPLTAQAGLSQLQLNNFASSAELHFEVVDNFVFGSSSHNGRIILDNKSKVAIPSGVSDWAIYMHITRIVDEEQQTAKVHGLNIEHVKGDLHRLVPTKDFKGLAAGETLAVNYKGSAWIVSMTDFMPRSFIVSGKAKPVIFANTDTEDSFSYVKPMVKPEQYLRYNEPKDLFPKADAALRYQANLAAQDFNLSREEITRKIIPTPRSVDHNRGETTFSDQWQIRYAGSLKSEATYLLEQFAEYGLSKVDMQAAHVPATSKQVLSLKVDADLSHDKKPGYTLIVEKNSIEIVATDNANAFYAIQSLLSLMPTDKKAEINLPRIEVEDSARYQWRGMHYDIGRNFHGKDNILKLIEQMAHYKLNKLHLHMTEDEGWRLQIPGLPELTDVGGKRCFDLTEQSCLLTQLGAGPHGDAAGNGYLTREDFIEILKFATVRHVEVIPEVDLPGHARAAIKSMEARYNNLMKAGKPEEAAAYLLTDPNDKSEYLTVQNYNDNSMDVCLDSSYNFIDKVLYEMQVMYRDAGIDLKKVHLGGDEVGAGSWAGSPACQALFIKPGNGISGVQDLKAYFMSRASQLLADRGLAMGGWEDGLMYSRTATFDRDSLAPDQVWANPWDNIWEWGVADRAYRLANEGFDVVLSSGSHLYLDHPYEAHPESRGYYWATRFVDTKRVFGYMPDNLYANADYTREGVVIENLEDLVGRAMPPLEKPENILGMQGHVWSETIRTPEQMQEMVFPRIIAIAERAWYKADWESDKVDAKARNKQWAEFANVLAAKEFARMSNKGIHYYLPIPGGVINNGKLIANIALPNFSIEYSLDGKSWQSYQKPVAVNGKAWLRSKAVDGRFSRVTQVLAK